MVKELTNNQIYVLYNALNSLATDYQNILISVEEGLKLVDNINYLTPYYWELEKTRQEMIKNDKKEELELLGNLTQKLELQIVDLNNLKLPLNLIIGLSPLLRG